MVRHRRRRVDYDEPRASARLLTFVESRSHPLGSSVDLDPLLERIGDARYVLLGEASHGTHEYYAWRDALSRRLIVEKGFSFIAVEGGQTATGSTVMRRAIRIPTRAHTT